MTFLRLRRHVRRHLLLILGSRRDRLAHKIFEDIKRYHAHERVILDHHKLCRRM